MAKTITIPADIGYSQKLIVYLNGMPHEFKVGDVYTVDDGVAATIESAIESYRASHGGDAKPPMLDGGAEALLNRLDAALERIENIELRVGDDFSLLNRYTVPAGGKQTVNLERDMGGMPYEINGLFVNCSISAGQSALSPLLVVRFAGGDGETVNCSFTNGVNTSPRYFCAHAYKQNGYWRMCHMPPQTTKNATAPMNASSALIYQPKDTRALPSICGVQLSVETGLLPAGSIIEIWGY